MGPSRPNLLAAPGPMRLGAVIRPLAGLRRRRPPVVHRSLQRLGCHVGASWRPAKCLDCALVVARWALVELVTGWLTSVSLLQMDTPA